MKKIITFILIVFSFTASAQTRYRYHTVIDPAKPAYSPNSVNWRQGHMSIVHDQIKKQIDFYTNNQSGNSWTYQFSIPIGGPAGTTYIPEFRATATAIEWKYTTDSVWTFLISLEELRGEKGEPGTPGMTYTAGSGISINGNVISATGGGSSVQAYVTPEQFGAVNANRTFAQNGHNQAYIDANYAGLGFTTSDNIDGAALSKAMRQNLPVFITRTLWINKLTPVRKDAYNTWVQGFNDTINVVGTPASLFPREQPASLAEAELMANFRGNFSGLIINCNNAVTRVFDLGASYQMSITNCRVFGGYSAYHFTFSMDARLIHCDATGSLYGSILDYYRYSWATRANTPCNTTTIDNFRIYGQTPATSIGVWSLATGEGKISQITGEGIGYKYLVFIDQAGLTTAKTWEITGVHYEAAVTAPEAVINLDIDGGYVRIDGMMDNGQPTIAIKAKSVGTLVINATNIGWWKLFNGKMFHNTDCGWAIGGLPFGTVAPNTSSNPNAATQSFQSLFAGTPVNIVGMTDIVQGYNRAKLLY